MKYDIDLPISIRVVSQDETKGIFEIDGLYAGYGHTLGNSLRRVILSSLPGAAVTTVKIQGVSHEFSNISGVKEDILGLLLNLKILRFKMHSDEPQTLTLSEKGPKTVTAASLKAPSQVEILNKDAVIATLVDKKTELNMELTIEKGLGYALREVLRREKVDIGVIALDAIFSPIRKIHYEVEDMRVGESTDYNRLRISIETDGSISPAEAFGSGINILISQFQSIKNLLTGGEKDKTKEEDEEQLAGSEDEKAKKETELEEDPLKIRVEDLNLSNRTLNALARVGIRTTGGLTRKKEDDLLKIEGLGAKSIQEIRRALGNFGLTLK
ncbi:MAG: DNA-directed RNA polymerase subunit alpha [Parcubacteria group bacterium GW2011_GWF2_42_7]|nr:MAG: DNA-directed RNA polymerase subunit alpha [Parcubacteria group bacterium GW2011_GWF2_42_7]